MSTTEFASVLANTLSGDSALRTNAEQMLQTAEANNYPEFLISAGKVLADTTTPPHIRQAAALVLKNAIKTKDAPTANEQGRRWNSIPPEFRKEIKNLLIQLLSDSHQQVSLATSQTVTAIAEIELPNHEWPELFPTLLAKAHSPESNSKLTSLRTVGYICEVIDPAILSTLANEILTAIITCANPRQQPDEEIRLAAMIAIQNSLDFIASNFDNEGERHYIMQVVCENSEAKSEELQVATFECLSKIVSRYYELMKVYFDQALTQITLVGLKDERERVAMQAIEFWSTVSDSEIYLNEAALDSDDEDETNRYVSLNFVQNALPAIVPLILGLMTKQDEDADEDEWNISLAAATCLSLIAKDVMDPIVPAVLPFVEQNIRNTNWHFREAAVMAFGSILEGPDSSKIAPLVDQAFPVLLELMQDSSPQVQDTVAWTLSNIAEHLSVCIKPVPHLSHLLEVLVRGLDSKPRIVCNCCWALISLIKVFNSPPHPQSVFGTYFQPLMQRLIEVSDNPTNNQASRSAVYEAIAVLVQYSADSHQQILEDTVLTFINRLNISLQLELQVVSNDDSANLISLQSSLCGVLNNLISRLGPHILPVADRIMEILFRMLTTSKNPGSAEDIFLCIGAMLSSLENEFQRYTDSFVPHLFHALQQIQEPRLCRTAIGLIGDICRILTVNCAPYCENFITALSQCLSVANIDITIIGAILSCYGDIALAIGPNFQLYLSRVMGLLYPYALQLKSHFEQTFEDYSYGELYDSLAVAYLGIIQAFKSPESIQLLNPYLDQIFNVLSIAPSVPDPSDEIVATVVGILGDLAEASPNGELNAFFAAEWIEIYIKEARSRKFSPQTRKLARWAKNLIIKTA